MAYSINDRTVPYVTAAIETEDPFAEHETNGIDMFVFPLQLISSMVLKQTYRKINENYEGVVESYMLPDNPPPRPIKARMLSPTWFRGLVPSKPVLPPFLQFRFPLNIVRLHCTIISKHTH